MERQKDELTQKKPWSKLTEEERQAIRESWKEKLPEEYDVYCIGNLVLTEDLHVPGNLYVSGDVSVVDDQFVYSIDVSCNFIVNGDIEAGNVTVGGDFIVNGIWVDICNTTVYGNFIAYGDIDVAYLTVCGDCLIRLNIDSFQINISDFFYCYDVQTNGHKIHAADCVCQCFYEKI